MKLFMILHDHCQLILLIFYHPGLMPYNFLTVHTGCLLSELSSMDNIFSWWTILKFFGIANAALLPGVLIKHYHDQREIKKSKKQ